MLTLAAAVLPALAVTPQRPNLQGKWKLNEDLTARLRERESERPEGGFRGGFGPPPGEPDRLPGGPGVPGGGGFPVEPPPGVLEKDRRPEGPPPNLEALNELTITQKDGEVTVTDKEGQPRVLKTDGAKVREEKGPDGPAEVRARWEKDGTLTVKVRPDKGPNRTESYVISNDRKHLYVTTTIDGEGIGRELRIRRAYDLAE
ncbi:MAG TPA: hypothetical protein VHC97_12850 [Thermoanaerobaculia bacterium]|nr:hypothetical protein [Thermoanaerobaculia bacterium]